MSEKWGSADFEELKKLQENLHKTLNGDIQLFCEACSKKLAAELLELVIPRTPVGDYPNESSKKGGSLRRGWTGGQDTKARDFAEGCKVYKNGSNYTILVQNTVSYTPYVEFGHRQEPGRYVPAIGKRLKANFVPGKRMLTHSEEDLRSIAPAMLEKRIEKFLLEVFDV